MSDEDYKDMDGNPVTLEKLIRTEPEWAASRVREGRKAEAELAARDKRIAELSIRVRDLEAACEAAIEKLELFEFDRARVLRILREARNGYKKGGAE